MEHARGRLTPAQILLIVVVSALVLLFAILLAGRLSGGTGGSGAEATAGDVAAVPEQPADALDGADPSASPTPAATPTPEATPTQEEPPEYFRAPSGNIACAVTIDSADCVIASFSYEPADAGSCSDEGAGGHLRVEPAGASMPCEPLVVAGDVPVLDYGETLAAHGYTCESAESGISCSHDESGYGFAVARAAYELF